jgi:two-component system LytT family response regulator
VTPAGRCADLVFLDVQMPGLDGFGVVEALGPERMPPTVFVTAYDAHAIRAFELLEFLPLETVDWIEAAGNYVRLHAGTRAELVRITLRGLLDQLDPTAFVRIHRSIVVNVGRIRSVHPWFGGDYTATLSDGRELRVSRHYRDALLKTVS